MSNGRVSPLQSELDVLLTGCAKVLKKRLCTSRDQMGMPPTGVGAVPSTSRYQSEIVLHVGLIPRPLQPTVDIIHISWHHRQVFKSHRPQAEAT
jgi:hypothetical protein